MIAVGVIRKPHGIRGEANVESLTHSLDRFTELTKVTLVSPDESMTRNAEIESARAHGERALIKFRDIDTPDQIRDLHNWTIEIQDAEARELDQDEYFLHDLVGLRLVDEDGRDRGVVKEVSEGGGGLLLVVETPSGEFDVPFASEICTKIDVGGGTITVDLPEGIDDLDHVED
ncbi:MAG TPA: ribosome maturation factor RimM [Thermoanaerobaculia bacterium]|nr:ribosome maturation factor RimM [Thermoanaerobaculia bacterium]